MISSAASPIGTLVNPSATSGSVVTSAAVTIGRPSASTATMPMNRR